MGSEYDVWPVVGCFVELDDFYTPILIPEGKSHMEQRCVHIRQSLSCLRVLIDYPPDEACMVNGEFFPPDAPIGEVADAVAKEIGCDSCPHQGNRGETTGVWFGTMGEMTPTEVATAFVRGEEIRTKLAAKGMKPGPVKLSAGLSVF